MKKYLDLPLRFVFILSGFLFIFNLPSLLGIGEKSIIFKLEHFMNMVNLDLESLKKAGDMRFLDLFSQINFLESYRYTMNILITSLTVVLILSLFISVLVLIAPRRLQNGLKNGINFFEAVPDLMLIFFIQFFVIFLYKSTGLKFLQLYGVFGAKPLFVPVVTISFLPLFLMTQYLVKILAEEQNQLYALYGTAKGLTRFRILIVHIFRNVFPLIILQLRTTIWVMLSNIYLVEFIFNLPGFTRFFDLILFRVGDVVALVICLLMFTLPLLMIEAISWFISKLIRGKEEVAI